MWHKEEELPKTQKSEIYRRGVFPFFPQLMNIAAHSDRVIVMILIILGAQPELKGTSRVISTELMTFMGEN